MTLIAGDSKTAGSQCLGARRRYTHRGFQIRESTDSLLVLNGSTFHFPLRQESASARVDWLCLHITENRVSQQHAKETATAVVFCTRLDAREYGEVEAAFGELTSCKRQDDAGDL